MGFICLGARRAHALPPSRVVVYLTLGPFPRYDSFNYEVRPTDMNRVQRIGRYFLTSRIAFGGMAEIFRGMTFDKHGNQMDVAVKKLLPHFVEDEQFVVMLTDEFAW